jgi:HNH endonuclease
MSRPLEGKEMVQTSNTSIMWETWDTLYQKGLTFRRPTECSQQCDLYSYKRYRKVFLDNNQPPFRCSTCKRQLSLKHLIVDHIDGIHNGFGFHNCPENLRALCKPCNSSQGGDLFKWRYLNQPWFREELNREETSRKAGLVGDARVAELAREDPGVQGKAI